MTLLKSIILYTLQKNSKKQTEAFHINKIANKDSVQLTSDYIRLAKTNPSAFKIIS